MDVSHEEVSPDWRFGIAYNAALRLCTILLHSSGYRATGTGHHYHTIKALSVLLGEERRSDAEYLDACRKKRNISEYDYSGSTTDDDVAELVSFVETLKNDVIDWLKENHPGLLRE